MAYTLFRASAARHILFAVLIGLAKVPGAVHAQPAERVADAGSVVINEVMASNAATIADPQGDYDDWIELYNTGNTPVDLEGMYLTDDLTEPTKWQIQAGGRGTTLINPKGYLIVWADRDTGDAGLHASFRLSADGDEVHLFDTDGTTLIDSMVFGGQTSDISYGRDPDAADTLRFFGRPTPARPNEQAYLGEVAPLQFSHERGFYSTAFDLTITTTTEDVSIVYTTDGRSPDDTSGGYRFTPAQNYTGPIRIGRTTCLRAMATKPGWKPTRLHTQTYVFDNRETVRSLPIVSLVGDPSRTFYEPNGVMAIVGGSYSGGVWASTGAGSYNNVMDRGLERPVSAEWLTPDDEDAFQIDCGLRVHGSSWMRPRYVRQNGYWTGNGKFSFRLYFRGQYGQSWLEYPLIPQSEVEQFATVVLRGGHNDRTNPFIKDELLRRLHRDMGQQASMGTFANLFINGEYKGFFNPAEHVKEEACQQWFDSDKPWDIMTMNGIRDGNSQSWDAMLSYARGNNLADPAHYAELCKKLDVVSFIDYLIIRLWPNDWDWPQNNWSAAGERSDTGRWKFFVWDAEGTFVASQIGLDRFGELNSQNNANGYLFRALKANRDFRQLFSDRLYKHFYNGGALTAENVERRYFELRDELRGVIPNMDAYIINGWVPGRLSVFLNACLREGVYTFAGPSFAINGSPQHGGRVSFGDRLAMLPSDRRRGILYTLDGSDPAEYASRQVSPTVTLVGRDAPKRVFVSTRPSTPDWRGSRPFNDSDWMSVSGYPGGVGYERESGYEPHISGDVRSRMYNVSSSCYIRIPFTLDEDRASLKTMTLKVQYDDGFIAYLNSIEVARGNFRGEPAYNSAASAERDDTAAVIFESIDISEHIDRLRQGDNMLAIHGLNTPVTSPDFLINAELTAEREVGELPLGGSQAYTDPIPLTKSVHVKARVPSGSTWSALAEATYAVGPVAESLRISEIMYHPPDTGHPDDPNTEYIELINVGTEIVNLNLVRFTNGIDFTFPDVELAPGGFCLVVKNRSAFKAKYGARLPVAGEYAGSLANNGERLELRDAAGTIIHNFRYEDDWHVLTDGAGFSLTVGAPVLSPVTSWARADTWRASATMDGSPGVDDGGNTLGSGAVLLNELLANSAGGEPDWIELGNTTGQPVDLGGWFLSDDADEPNKYEIASGTVLPPLGHLVFTEDGGFGNRNDPGCHTPFGLSRTGETVYLHSGAQGALTGYRDEARFGPSESGVTLGRYCNDATSCVSTDLTPLTEATPGAPNAEPLVGPIVISEIMYHADHSVGVEYVELCNISGDPVTLYDSHRGMPWRFTDGSENPDIDLLFPEDRPVTLASRGYLVLV